MHEAPTRKATPGGLALCRLVPPWIPPDIATVVHTREFAQALARVEHERRRLERQLGLHVAAYDRSAKPTRNGALFRVPCCRLVGSRVAVDSRSRGSIGATCICGICEAPSTEGASSVVAGYAKCGLTCRRKLLPDVDESVADVAGWITPRLGGVGPTTIAMLMRNIAQACEARSQRDGASGTHRLSR
jgi:hypothetical protein